MKRYYPYSFTYFTVLFYGLFFIVPSVVGLSFAFTNWGSENLTDWAAVKFVGLDHFRYLFSDSDFNQALTNTFAFAAVTTFLKVFLGLLLALGLNRKLITRQFLRAVYYIPAVLSVTVVGLLFSAIFSMDGIFNRLLQDLGMGRYALNWLGDNRTAMSIVMSLEVWKWSGFCMMIFLAGLQTISRDYYEASSIDGASRLQQFRRITFPLLMPAITINMTLNLIGGFKVFDQVYVLTNGRSGTEVLNTQVYRAFSNGLYGRSSAMGLILFGIIAIVTLVVTSYLKRKEVDY
ncbi:carbohydrate ABC transporter permease [Cohnella rhizosphaerae]|uniref:Sugar ABC transporter permease n=1 Tax=Cohnella rhizosphaerae TaxID=1457232 RepID=A0A9X4QTW5_9BACL|nr:sugar ABC transporter permease [Cohnella rhizosphaerae]MDG0811120.1 sugar ABC transporter permease [Cohnella rhizosphaerae]